MTLMMYYRLHFDVATWHNISLTEIENMIVYERDLYVSFIQEKNKREEGSK